MLDFLSSPSVQIFLSQLITVLLVLVTFLSGIWARGSLDEGEMPLTRLIVLLTACIPPFASGFTAREQIKKWLTSPKPTLPAAGVPAE